MRPFRLLFLALMFLLHTTFVSAASVHTCCMDIDCPVVQCVSMGCAVSAAPAAVDRIAVPVFVAANMAFPAFSQPVLPEPAEEIWCPPD